MSSMKVQLLYPYARVPTRGTLCSAGLDLYSITDLVISPGETVKIPIGIATEIPCGWVGLIRDRSSIGSQGIITTGGVIDSDYRGEWVVCLHNANSSNDYWIHVGDRIAQVVLVPHFVNTPHHVQNVDKTKRSTAGFGSTNKGSGDNR